MATTSLTFAELLVQLQALTPEQLAQPAHVWGEQVPYVTITGVQIAQNDYVCEDGECWELEPGQELEDESGDGYDPAISKGEVWLAINY